jgi:chemotaxis signal transduction protein
MTTMNPTDGISEYVCVGLGSQLFGLPIAHVQDVFVPERVTRIRSLLRRSPGSSMCAAVSSP